MNTLEEKKRFMRDYWLNSLSDNQIEKLETEWFANDEDAELLEVVRGDLIEDYLTNSLSRAELDKFKNHFLINNLEEVAIAKSYLELPGETPRKQAAKAGFFEALAENWRGFIRIPQIAFALLLVLGGFALFVSFYNSAPPSDVARIGTPAESDLARKNQDTVNSTAPSQDETKPGAGDEDNSSSSESSRDNSQNSGEESAKSPSGSVKNKTTGEKTAEKPAPRAAEPQSPVLFLTNFRGNVKTLALAGESRNFSLKLDMPGLDKAYQSYEIRIYDSNNNLVVQQKLNDNLSLKKSGEKIEIRNLSKNKFKKNNTYKTYLVGYDEKNNVEELSLYDSFKVN
jgi:hypothetical protein